MMHSQMDKVAGALSGTLTLKHIDAKGKLANRRITLGGVTTGGTAAGTVTPKGGKAKSSRRSLSEAQTWRLMRNAWAS